MENLEKLLGVEREIIENILKESLGGAERNIIEKHYGLNGNERLSMEEISKELNISFEKVREIELKGINKIKNLL